MDRKGTCKVSSCTVGLVLGSVTGYKGVSTDSEQALVSAVPQQPVPIASEADQPSLSIAMKSSCIGASVLLSKASAATTCPNCDLMWVHFKTKCGKVVLENVLRPVLLQRQKKKSARRGGEKSNEVRKKVKPVLFRFCTHTPMRQTSDNAQLTVHMNSHA